MIENIEQGTDIVKVNPRGDEAVIALHNNAVKLRDYAAAKVITGDADLSVASNDLSIIKELKKLLETSRKDYLAPLETHKKNINEAFAEITAPINEADIIMRGKVLGYQQEQERIRAEQAEINRLKQEALDREMELKGKVDEPVEMIAVDPEKEKRIVTEAGAVGQRVVKKWRLVDFSLLPDIYKLPDSAKITKLVKGGGAIAGIEVYDEPILTVASLPIKQGTDQLERLPF